MLSEISQHIEDPGVLRKLIFATTHLPKDLPRYWEVITDFSARGSTHAQPSLSKIQALVENIEDVSAQTFATDKDLLDQLRKECVHDKPLGVVLVSPRSKRQACRGELRVKADRPSRLVVYTESGTLPGTHYRKICKNSRKGCNTTQHYGFSSTESGVVTYDDDWQSQAYFLSSRETAIEMKMLTQLDAAILIGQISYKQQAEIYNYTHGYSESKTEAENLAMR